MASVVAWPFLRGYGRTPSVPSLLDRPYGTGFLALIAVVGTIALAWTALSFVRNARNLGMMSASSAQMSHNHDQASHDGDDRHEPEPHHC